MRDDDLERLAKADPPPPRAGALERARDAGLAAFREQKKEQRTPQGSRLRDRLTAIFNLGQGRWTMEKRMVAGGMLASALVLVFAVQIARDGMDLGFVTPQEEHLVAQPIDNTASEQARASEAPVEPAAPTDGRTVIAETAEVRRKQNEQLMADAEVSSLQEAQPVPSPPASARVRGNQIGAAGVQNAGPVGLFSGGVASDQYVRPMPDRRPETVVNRDQFEEFETNPLRLVTEDPVATFSIDVDTASYAFVRRSINSGQLPPRDAVRVEEMINYFPYDYAGPQTADEPFATTLGIYPSPWNPENRLLHIGIKGYDESPAEQPAANLVFLVDVSGSMNQPDKLPLLKNALRLLVNRLDADDTVAIVTYAGEAGTALEPTPVSEKGKILTALDGLGAGGSTAGAAGIERAYALARESFVEDGVNRVILATDGDFNVGVSDPDKLEDLIAKRRDSGIFLSVLGFGQGNYNDTLMQRLAQNGNGVAAYIDTLNEARKVLVEEAGSTLFPIAKDVKIQIEFNPARVAEYRLIGYETRALAREDFNNDRVDAGDIGSGHTVTALFEITPTGSSGGLIDDLRYGTPSDEQADADTGEFAFLKLRYKQPDGSESQLITRPVTDADVIASIDAAPVDMRFAASVAAFGQKLRGGQYLGDFGYDAIADLADGARGADRFGYRAEFLGLVRLAETLDDVNGR